MLDPYELTDDDFKELGFHAGIEVHHQLRSKRKLFCNCPPILEEDPNNADYHFFRYFRPVLGEMGDFDPGMLVEFEKGYKVIYNACERNTCTYEFDETPPFYPDMETVKKGFLLAFYFGCSALAEEIVVNRKQYLDGSITTGFQRTFIIARDGFVPVGNKEVRVSNLHIEEDAARRVNWDDTSDRTVYYNLDRLGVPLTEIITDHKDINTPTEFIELTKKIGLVLRLSHIGRRGLGSVRQDINISIAGGDRAEIKGVQDIALFDTLCRHEVVRQQSLLDIKEEMEKREITKEDFEHTYVDISHVFNSEEDTKVFATIFPKMKGLFGLEIQPNKDFGQEIFEKSMLITGIKVEDHFHSDELDPNAVRQRSDRPFRLAITSKLYETICSIIKPQENDSIVLVRGPERRAMHAMKKIVERVKQALDGVPQETRRFLLNGNTEYLRTIHGKERIYPDTDTPPIVIPLSDIKKWKKEVSISPWKILSKLESYGLNPDQIELLVRTEEVEKFFEYGKNINPFLAYRLLVELPREKSREGITITDTITDKLYEGIKTQKITKDQIHLVLPHLLKDPNQSFSQIKEEIGFEPIKPEELKEIIKQVINEVVDADKLKGNPTYQDWAIRRITGTVIQQINFTVSGEKIATQARNLLEVK